MARPSQRLIGANDYTPTVHAFWNQANVAGSGAGSSVTVNFGTAFQDQYGTGILPGDATSGQYAVGITPSQVCLTSVTNKTASGFNVVLTPSPSTATLVAGTFDVLVHS
jgi:hypothetical protein